MLGVGGGVGVVVGIVGEENKSSDFIQRKWAKPPKACESTFLSHYVSDFHYKILTIHADELLSV